MHITMSYSMLVYITKKGSLCLICINIVRTKVIINLMSNVRSMFKSAGFHDVRPSVKVKDND